MLYVGVFGDCVGIGLCCCFVGVVGCWCLVCGVVVELLVGEFLVDGVVV